MKTPAELKAIANEVRAAHEKSFRASMLDHAKEINEELQQAADCGVSDVTYNAMTPKMAKALAEYFESLGFSTLWCNGSKPDRVKISFE